MDLILQKSSCAISGMKSVELAHAIKMRVLDPEVGFPTVPHLPNSDLCTESYGQNMEHRTGKFISVNPRNTNQHK